MIIILINGAGRSGKDYLIEKLSQTRNYTFSFNYVQGIKDIAKAFGYKEERKNDKDRNFLHDLKKLTDIYSDFCFLDTLKKITNILNVYGGPNALNIKEGTMFIHIGEMTDIDRMKDYLESIYHNMDVYTMWIQSDASIGLSDPRFDGTHNDVNRYDIVFENKMNDQSVKEFRKLIKKLHKKANRVRK